MKAIDFTPCKASFWSTSGFSFKLCWLFDNLFVQQFTMKVLYIHIFGVIFFSDLRFFFQSQWLLHSIITSLAIFLIYNVVPGRPELFVEQNEVTVSVSWTLQQKNGIIKNYEVTYVREDNYMDRRSIPTNKTKHEYKDLQAGKTYKFQVYFKHHISSTANYFVSILIIIIIGILVFFCFSSHSQTHKVPNWQKHS